MQGGWNSRRGRRNSTDRQRHFSAAHSAAEQGGSEDAQLQGSTALAPVLHGA